MNYSNFLQAFRQAMGSIEPYQYQCRLACGPDAALQDIDSLCSGASCQSQLINVPTGLGKTAAVVLAWLWNRVLHPEISQRNSWPRRLIYCLPMRTLVEQTHECVTKWLERLNLSLGDNPERCGKVGLHILMGGEDDGEWDLYPEGDAILIGTQDMLLSMALNRGYGMSRYRWPMHFGLLNNDVLWVLDETQLMGPGLSTACQLEAFRKGNDPDSPPKGFGTIPRDRSVTWYVSATASTGHLGTREWRGINRPADFCFGLGEEEKAETSGPIFDRRFATKKLELRKEWNFGETQPSKEVIADILNCHQRMVAALGRSQTNAGLARRTLIICNTVDRAISIYSALKYSKLEGLDLLLLHSRFRPPERQDQMVRLGVAPDLSVFPTGQIIIATQVIEAGVNLSSAVLWTEVAPLASLVQRLGRLNRAGEFEGSDWTAVAVIVGVCVEAAPEREKKEDQEERVKRNAKRCLPYELKACESSWASLSSMNGNASSANLALIQNDIEVSIPRCPYSLQRHELLDFFDTDANLSLGFTDVSPFVRGLDEDADLQVLWRDLQPEQDGHPDPFPDYQRDELCPVPIGKARVARHLLDQGWIWRGKESGWISVRDSGLAPGMTILLPLSTGGYDAEIGWTGKPEDNRHRSHYRSELEPSDEDMLTCLSNGWRSIAAHTAEVAGELENLLDQLLPREDYAPEREAYTAAVPWHDVGKIHSGWQRAVLDALREAGITVDRQYLPFAKFSLSDSPRVKELSGAELKRKVKELRRFFRPKLAHEVASALAFRQSEQARHAGGRHISSLLAEYLIMSHHGRVRKVLRDELPRFPTDAKDNDTVRGITEGSELPPIAVNGENLGCAFLSMGCRRMGRDVDGNESYTRGVLRLLETYGPFRLAYFEALFRAADIRASITAAKKPAA